MTILQNKIKKLSEKRNYIRDGLKKFMEDWGKNTYAVDVTIGFSVLKEDFGHEYYLVTGAKDIQRLSEWGGYIDYSENNWSWKHLEISQIKEIIRNLSSAITEIEKKIDKKIISEKNITFPKY